MEFAACLADLVEFQVPDSNRKLFVRVGVPVATIGDLTAIKVFGVNDEEAAIEISLTPSATKRLAAVAMAHANKPVAIFLGGKLLAAVTIREKIDEKIIMTGTYSRAEAGRIATDLSRVMDALRKLLPGLVGGSSETVWGEPVNGLRLGMVGIANDSHFSSNETIRFGLRVQNVGSESIRFHFIRSKNCYWTGPGVEKKNGERVRVEAMLFRGGHYTFDETLAPNEEVDLHLHGILVLGSPEDAHKWWPRISTPEIGEYRLTAGALPFYLIDAQGERMGKYFGLTSGHVNIHVDDAEE